MLIPNLKCSMAQFKTLIKNFPKLRNILLRATSNIYQIDGDNTGIKATIILVALTYDEIDMLAHLMLEQHFKREFGKLKAFSAQDLPTSLQVFSPANERASIRALVKDIHEENMTMLDNYMAKDRSTRKRKTIDYDTYASYSE